ncbi:MAG: beta-N-acetylhexosaminidase [Ktedonobacteraceae bacterium]
MHSYTTDMTLEEQIGQLLMVGFWETVPSQEIIDLIQHYHVGSIILFSRNIQNLLQVFELTQSLQAIARAAGHRRPLLIAIDQENGNVRRLGQDATIFPGNMTLGAIGSEQVTYEVAQAAGRELKALGINMNLAPVADVNNNPANPAIGVRSFGEDPHEVARLTAAAVRGYRAAGVIATLKHFPGHGDTAIDSHLALPTIPSTLERLEAIELVPFRSGIEAGAPSVMTAHIYLPHIMSHDVLPATISPAVIQGLLRERLGFTGVVISDCMEMNAITETVGAERGALMALQAGNDLVLVSHTHPLQKASFATIRAALENGELAPDVVRQAAERVLQLKDRYLSWDNLPTPSALADVGSAAHQQLRDRAYELSITLVRNQQALIPLHLAPHERILVLSQHNGAFSQAVDKYFSLEYLAACIRRRHENVQAISAPPLPTEDEYQQQILQILQTAGEVDVIIMATVNANLDQQQAKMMQGLMQTGRRVIGIAVGTPYDLLAFPQLGTYLVTYEYSQPALDAVVRVLFGEIQAQGHLPVSLPGLYARGQG